jgi:hypothetical protein
MMLVHLICSQHGNARSKNLTDGAIHTTADSVHDSMSNGAIGALLIDRTRGEEVQPYEHEQG